MKNRILIKLTLLITFCNLLLIACTEEVEMIDPDIRTIQQYVEAKMLEDVQSDENGLHYIIKNEGSIDGLVPKDTSNVIVNYEGRLINDIIFDRRDSINLDLISVVPGFRQGIKKIREGGEVKLILPSTLAYGAQARNLIPPGSILIFDIELISVLDEN